MSEYFIDEQHAITTYRKRNLLSQDMASYLREKLFQKDKVIVSLFKTLKWSENEEAFFEKISHIHLPDSKPCSNFSTETSLKIRVRPSAVVVPANRTLKNYLKGNNEKSFEVYEKEEEKSQKPIKLSKMKCFQEIKFASESSDNEEGKSNHSLCSSDLELAKISEHQENALKSVTNFLEENREKNSLPLNEKKMSIDEIVEKYEKSLENDAEVKIEDNFSNDELLEEEISNEEKHYIL